MVGIVGYGVYIPKKRILLEEIANAWGKNADELIKGLGVEEKAVASTDEDTVSLSVESSLGALETAKINPWDLGALLIGSESHPYAVNPTASTVGEILGLSNNYLSVDLEFACKAGTTAMQLIYGLIESGKVDLGLAIGADVAQAKPGDILEYTAGSASASYILGKKKVIAEIVDFTSFSSNTPDFWRREGQKFPSHGGRFTREPAYFAHVIGATNQLLKKTKLNPRDFDYAIFHMPNGKFPLEAAKKLGFTPDQLSFGFVVDKIGNPYSASSLVGLAATLDQTLPNKKIFVCSYGSGAGSDAFYLKTTPLITAYQKSIKLKVLEQINLKSYVNYITLMRSYMAKGVI